MQKAHGLRYLSGVLFFCLVVFSPRSQVAGWLQAFYVALPAFTSWLTPRTAPHRTVMFGLNGGFPPACLFCLFHIRQRLGTFLFVTGQRLRLSFI